MEKNLKNLLIKATKSFSDGVREEILSFINENLSGNYGAE